MNSVDLIVLIIILINGAIGAYRGLVWQAVRIGSIVLGLWLGMEFATAVSQSPPISWLGWEEPTVTIAAWSAILVSTYLAMAWIAHVLRRWIDKARLTSSDRSLGFLLGSAKGAVFVALGLQVLLLGGPVVPGAFQAQLESSQAANLHKEWLKDALDDATPHDMRLGG